MKALCSLLHDESRAKRGREMLESLRYYTVARTSAIGACAAFTLARRYFDLLIVDHVLSDMTGDQLARECQRLRPNLPVILCIDSQEAVSVEKAHSLGIAELIVRLLVAHDIAHVIRRVLDRSPRHKSPASLIEESNAIGPRD